MKMWDLHNKLTFLLLSNCPCFKARSYMSGFCFPIEHSLQFSQDVSMLSQIPKGRPSGRSVSQVNSRLGILLDFKLKVGLLVLDKDRIFIYNPSLSSLQVNW